MAEKKWLAPYVERAVENADQLRDRIATQYAEQEELDQLAELIEFERQPILEKAEKFLAENVQQVNQLADDLVAYAFAPVDKPEKMTPELFIHPPNIASRMLFRVSDGSSFINYAYYFYWPIHFYETKVRLCLTISDQEEPLFVMAKDLTPDSLYRFETNDLEELKKRLCRNIERHVYLNTLYQAGVFQ